MSLTELLLFATFLVELIGLIIQICRHNDKKQPPLIGSRGGYFSAITPRGNRTTSCKQYNTFFKKVKVYNDG